MTRRDSGEPANPSEVAESREVTPAPARDIAQALVAVSLWGLVVFLVLRFFTAARFVVLAGLGTAALAAGLQPMCDWLPGPKAVRAVTSAAIVLTVTAGLLGVLGWAMYGPIVSGLQSLPELHDQANELIGDPRHPD